MKCILIVQSILYVLNSGDNQLYTVLSILLILWSENSFAVIKVFDGFWTIRRNTCHVF